MSSKILVSGSSGLIGSALIPALQENGYEVIRLVRGYSSAQNQIAWNPGEPIRPETVSGYDAVVHLAGESIVGRWTEAKKARIRESRIVGTRHLAEALAKARQRPQVLVCSSAIGYYGNRGDEILREESPSGSGFLADVCLGWECANIPASQAGIRTVQVRTGIVLSKDGGALPKMLTPFRLGVGGKMGSGRQWWSWIALQDMVGAILHALKTSSVQGPVNAVAPNPVRNAEFTKILGSVLSRPTIFPMPAFAARLVLGQMADELLLSSQRVEPSRLKSSGYVFQRPELQSALEALLKKS
ncbi:MAG TPA: TIGR01777 family oxidoreductase [Terriglobales bacterium]|nr:TIGR01777 family oxidoreductase [Terriglobales bacterium]